ncbi:OmpW family outer membrane protein [Burkholderia seminalis]|nr:OmpW family outer membrane protein [Burkholderia seminalis]
MFKYYLGERDDRFRPFAGIGVRYMRFTNTNLNPVFQRKLASLGGLLAAGAAIASLQSLLLYPALFQRIWDAGGDLLLSRRTHVLAKVKGVWEPVFTGGASYQITRRLRITGMVTYIPAADEDHARHQPAEPGACIEHLRYFGQSGAGRRAAELPLLTAPAAGFHQFDARRWDNGGVWPRQ